jgi:Ca2+-dependent lipid-binding protein
MSKEFELGTLVIVVLKARNLHDKHSFFKQDVYARISLNGTIQNTPVDIKGGQHPVWDAEIRFPVLNNSGEKYRTLEISCWAKENKEDDMKGTAKVDILETLQTGEFDGMSGFVAMNFTGCSRCVLPRLGGP